MKILVLGDIHGRDCWEDIINIENPDRVIFLGDYVSTHYDISEEDQIANLIKILAYKKDNPNKVILLRGNHDMQHCGFAWAECSGLYFKVYQWMSENCEMFLDLTQWVHVEDDIIFSHAGISKTWFDENEFKSVEDINKEIPTCKFAFTPCRWSDCTGTSKTQPLTWIRPQTLILNALDNRTQVVGHTPVIQVCNITQEARLESDDELLKKLEGAPDVWCCDNLPKGYLIIEDKQFKPIKYERR